MKGKHLAILLLLVAVLGGAWYLLSQRTRASWSESGGAGGKVVEFPINEVAGLRIKDSTGEVNLVRKNDAWTVQERGDYPANFEQVSELLRKLWELKTVQEVKAGASQLPRLELVEPGQGQSAGTLIEFKDKDGKVLNALVLGKKHLRKSEAGPHDFGGFPTGRYVKTLAGSRISLVSESFENVASKPEQWLQKDFVKIEGPKSIAVAGPTDAQRWTVTRENLTGDWQLADAKPEEKLDAAKVSPLSSVFAAPALSDVLAADAKPEETGLDKPTVATIETFDGFRYELKIGKAMGENHPVLLTVNANFPKERPPVKDEKPEDKARLDGEFAMKQKQFEEKLAKEKKFEGRPYLVPKFTVEPLLKERATLLPDKPAETSATPPAPGEPAAASSVPVPPPPAASAPITVTPPVTAPETTTPPPVVAPPPPAKIEAVTPPVQAPPPPADPPAPKPPEPAPPAPSAAPTPAAPESAVPKPEPPAAPTPPATPQP